MTQSWQSRDHFESFKVEGFVSLNKVYSIVVISVIWHPNKVNFIISYNIYHVFHFRYTIKEITNHPFFQEDSGVKVDLVEAEHGADVDHTKPTGTVKLLLQLEDPKKRKDKHKENEGIQFDFNLDTDQPEKVTQELVSKHFVSEKSYSYD